MSRLLPLVVQRILWSISVSPLILTWTCPLVLLPVFDLTYIWTLYDLPFPRPPAVKGKYVLRSHCTRETTSRHRGVLNRVSQICVKTIPSCRAYCFTCMKFFLDSSDVSRRRYWVCMKSPKTDFLLFHDFLNWTCVDNISSLTQARVLKFLPNIQFGVGNMPMLSIWHSLTTGEFSLPLSYLWMGSKSRSPSR